MTASQEPELATALRTLRDQVSTLRQHNASPAVERSLQMVDMNLHLALWQLGEMDEPMPELAAE
jgi:hypothetical protein